jgi:hypothetical protein
MGHRFQAHARRALVSRRPIDNSRRGGDNPTRQLTTQERLRMSTDASFGDFPPPPAKSGSKVWIWLGLGCGAMLLLCCGGIVGGSYYFAKQLNIKVSHDPVEVAKASGEIAQVDVPPVIKPKFSMSFGIAGQGFKMVVYEGNEEGGVFLMEMSGQQNPEAMRAQMDMQIKQQQGGQGSRQIAVSDSKIVELEIRGKPATFTIQKGTDPQSKKEFVQAFGTFEAKEDAGTDMLFMQLSADKYSEEQAEQIIRSIK